MKRLLLLLLKAATALCAPAQTFAAEGMVMRIAEIEIYPEHLTEYLQAAAEVGGTSVREELGVVCIFPMQMQDNPTQIRILEIYRSQEAYESHIRTPHFLRYKTGTERMVKSLKLPTVQPLDPKAMPYIFAKLTP